MDIKVSLCMIVKNEEEYLSRCLESIKDVVDEIVIVDTGSIDKTIEIAKNYGAKIYYYKWNNNFSEARNESLKYATKDWILILDADEEFRTEYKENLKLLLNNSLDKNAVYFFETLNYYGDSVDDNRITINLNPRLYKNNVGIHYEGEIHNQLVSSPNHYDAICKEIKIDHYGYLSKTIKSKNKRNRNISILNEQIKKDPNNKFAYFNLGNEYTALGDPRKSLEYYYKAYEDFNPHTGFSAILILRIVIGNYNIQKYSKALDFIDVGVKYYPQCTDFYFFKSLVYKDLDKPTLRIKALEKCIELGESPPALKFFHGSGSFKAYYELGNAYLSLKDYDTSYNYYIESLKAKPDFIDSIYCITHILKEKQIPIEEFKITLTSFFSDYPRAYQVIADIFYYEDYFETSLEYLKKCEKSGISTEKLTILKAKCLVRTGNFNECINMNSISINNPNHLYFSMHKVISCLLINKHELALSILSKFNENTLSNYNKKLLKVYSQLIKLLTKEPTEMLSEDTDTDYYNIIIEILEIMLINRKFDELEIAVNLLNLIDSKFALLYLGKLYYKHGYFDLAKEEIERSIKEFGIYDIEGLDILKSLLSSP